MSFDEALRRLETALAAFERARTETTGWPDALRERFDAQRLRPLADAGTQLETALRRAQEQCDAADMLLSR